MNEFDIIESYFLPLTMGKDETAGLKDDAAVIAVPEGREIVISSDTLNAGTHFLKDEAPENIARKALRVSLSDLASMGADPLCYQLNIAYPQRPEGKWLKAFTDALLEDQKEFGVFCSGGDTTSTHGALSISITVIGTVPSGKAIRRSGAKDGDLVVLTGVIGDAALGLKALWGRMEDHYGSAVARYRVPEPRIGLSQVVRDYANAAIDISDGLMADLGHICAASLLGAEVKINPQALVFSGDVQMALDVNFVALDDILAGGDDYELVLAVSPEHEEKIMLELKKMHLKPMVIGVFKDSISGITVFDGQGKETSLKASGWQHF